MGLPSIFDRPLKKLAVVDIGRTRFSNAWELQQKVFHRRQHGLIGDTLVFTEHEHVYTIGKGGNGNHLLASEKEINDSGIEVYRIDRGGDITYHGPGQLVGYPIIDLNSHFPDIHRYLRCLEEAIILSLNEYGIEATREPDYTGVWFKGEKIAAIGVKVSKWITMHGFALNVNTDLTKFSRIIPCGIFHRGVTSMERILGKKIAMDDVRASLSSAFCEVFGCEPCAMTYDWLKQAVRDVETVGDNNA
jgi:lipoyl(octanoyl) transferase